MLSEFTRLIGDPKRIEDAATFARVHHLSRGEMSRGVASAYAAFMKLEAYVAAAEIAWRFGLGQSAIAAPAALQRARAGESAERALARRNEADGREVRLQAETDLREEALIGCFFSSDAADGKAAVEDAIAFRAAAFDDDVLFPLLSARCPVGAKWRELIIDLAFMRGMDAYAIRHAAESDWPLEQRIRLVWGYFSLPRCSAGFRAVAALRIPPAQVVTMIERSACETASISSAGWSLDQDDARTYFFAAVRRDRFNLALALLTFCGFDGNGPDYLFQEALRRGRGAEVAQILFFHSGYHDAFMRYAYDQGRYRFVGTFAQTQEWQEKAFDKLVELGQYDFAAEVAQYGFSESLRSQGVIKAFRAAMANGRFKTGRYFVARYGPTKTKPGLVTQAMYEEARKKRYADQAAAAPGPESPKPTKTKPKRRKRTPCPKDDWCVGAGK